MNARVAEQDAKQLKRSLKISKCLVAALENWTKSVIQLHIKVLAQFHKLVSNYLRITVADNCI